MKQTIYTQPNKEYRIAGFVGEENLLRLIKQNISNKFSEYGCIRIESEKGNGSSYLLHSIANYLTKMDSKCTFLQFKAGDKFSDLTKYHLQNAHLLPYLFIENIHFILGNKLEETELVNFITKLAQNNVQLFYSSIQEETIENKIMIEKPFSKNTLGIILHPLSTELKYLWAKGFVNNKTLKNIPKEIFEKNESNADFLLSIQPFISEYKSNLGINFDEINNQKDLLNDLEIRFYRVKLNILELNSIKSDAIHNQQYEKAADIRDEQIKLESELYEIDKTLLDLAIKPRPSKEAIGLYIYYNYLLNHLRANENSINHTVDNIENKLIDLNEQTKTMNNIQDQLELLEIQQEIFNWKQILARYKR